MHTDNGGVDHLDSGVVDINLPTTPLNPPKMTLT